MNVSCKKKVVFVLFFGEWSFLSNTCFIVMTLVSQSFIVMRPGFLNPIIGSWIIVYFWPFENISSTIVCEGNFTVACNKQSQISTQKNVHSVCLHRSQFLGSLIPNIHNRLSVKLSLRSVREVWDVSLAGSLVLLENLWNVVPVLSGSQNKVSNVFSLQSAVRHMQVWRHNT